MATKTIPASIRKYMSRIGKRGGKSKSEKKIAAVKENGKAGGWWNHKKTTREAVNE